MCNKIHYESAKCTANMIYKIFDEDYSDGDDSNTCAFIESIQSGTYNQKGEIHLDSDEYGDSIEPKVTAGQTFGLAATLLLCLMLGMYSCYLHHNITNLLIKSLSHSHLLPPSRHRSRSRQRSRTGNKRKEQEEQLDHSTTPGVSA
mmetsp:Transcript_5752/g.8321  ORF Transcript_5752/g.8321 Transcript_5752/m.8321 type:complete len:146 (+) Transcript_5752:94-531(+)